MPRDTSTWDILFSCPSDAQNLLPIAQRVVERFNGTIGRKSGIQIYLNHWSKDSYPKSGQNPQDVLNEEIVKDSDACIALFKTRFGSPTTSYGSGTEEEIESMISEGKQVFLYFIETALPPSEIDTSQLEKVREFKSRHKGLYQEIKSDEEFEKKLFDQLTMFFNTVSVRDSHVSETADRAPSLSLSIVETDGKLGEKGLEFPYTRTSGYIYARRLDSRVDLTKEIKNLVTVDDINAYNAALPSPEEVEAYNKQNALYENANNNAHYFRVNVNNSGDLKATSVTVTLFLPEGLQAYYGYELKRLEKPEQLKIPENPVEKALERDYLEKLDGIGGWNGLAALEQLKDIFGRYNQEFPTINAISPIEFAPEHTISTDHDKVTIPLGEIVHTLDEVSESIHFIVFKEGVFKIDYSIICEEFKTPQTGSFYITVIK